MSHFYATVTGPPYRKTLTKCGEKTYGMSAHVRGWDTGVFVEVQHRPDLEGDQVSVYRTGGSNNDTKTLIAQWIDDGSVTFIRQDR